MDEAAALKEHGLPPPGTLLANRYRVERLLGVGGMGCVVLARHELIGQPVALKLLNREATSNASAVQRFMNEAKAAARIEGEHIVRVYDVGILEDSQPYICMEYLRGEDLGQLVDRVGRIPFGHACNAILDAIAALGQAHAIGIVHRDLKPSNLFLAEQPTGPAVLKILDFGIAKMEDPNAAPVHATSTGTIMGTPAYMAPEQMRNSKTVDARADIWALGAITYELITGRVPFLGDSLGDILFAVIEKPPPALHELAPNVPPELSAVVANCLNRDPDKRYQDVAALAEALEPFASADRLGSASAMRSMMSSASMLPSAVVSDPSFDTAPTAAALGGVSGRAATMGEWTAGAGAAPPKRTKRAAMAVGVGVFLVMGAVAAFGLSRANDRSIVAAPAPSGSAITIPIAVPSASAPPVLATAEAASDAGLPSAAPVDAASPQVAVTTPVSPINPTTPGKPTNGGHGGSHPSASGTTPTTPPPNPANSSGLVKSSGWNF